MWKNVVAPLLAVTLACAAELPSRKYLNLDAVKTMAAAAETEAKKRNVEVTICIVDENGNVLFLQKGDRPGISTVNFAMRKAKHAAIYGQPSKAGADRLKGGDQFVLAMPDVSQSGRSAH